MGSWHITNNKLRSLKDNFKRAFGSEVAECYTSCVRRKLQELYTHYIENDNDMEEDDDELSDGSIEKMAVDSSTTPLEQSRDEQCHLQDGSHAEAETELDQYLQDSPARQPMDDFDILNWWKGHGSVKVIGCSSLRGGGGELGTNKNFDL